MTRWLINSLAHQTNGAFSRIRFYIVYLRSLCVGGGGEIGELGSNKWGGMVFLLTWDVIKASILSKLFKCFWIIISIIKTDCWIPFQKKETFMEINIYVEIPQLLAKFQSEMVSWFQWPQEGLNCEYLAYKIVT